jgi:PAS domain S-box-containing protein
MPPPFLTWALRSLALSLAYALISVLALRLALPPNYATPLYPSAGLALAALLCWGWRMVPAVVLGAFAANVLLSVERGHPSLLGPALIGIGAGLQAWAGAWLVQRLRGDGQQDLTLTEPRELALFYALGAGFSCLISPSMGAAALWLNGAATLAQLPSNWGHWWVGDTLGVLIGAPITLTLIGQPRATWAPRRVSVALPMLAATLLMVLATAQVIAWETQGQRQAFERDALATTNALETALQEPLQALAANQVLFSIYPGLNRREFERGSVARLVNGSRLLALGWAARVGSGEAAGVEQAARRDGLADFRVHERQRPGDLSPGPTEDRLAIRLIEPLQRNASALGVNIRAIPQSLPALEHTVRTGLPAATAGFRLSQDSGDNTGVVLYQAVYAGEPGTESERQQALRGVVFATIRPDQVLEPVVRASASYLAFCLVDTDPHASRPVLAGPAGCEAQPLPGLSRVHKLQYSGRTWELRTWAAGAMPSHDGMGSLLFAVVGLISTALLGALLLTVTGRAKRIADLVTERTAELSREVQERERAAQALHASEERFRNIFEHAAVGLVFTDLRGVPQQVNPYFCRLVGYSSAELMQRSSISITHPDDRAEDLRLGRSLLRGEIDSYRRDKRYITKFGQIVQVRALVSMQRDARGEPFRLVGVVEDVTDQLRLRELERARSAAEAANQAKNEFLSRISHELRTPLNAMLGFTQLLELGGEQQLSEQQRGWLAQIRAAGWHLLELINETLDWSRIETGALKLELAPQALEPLLASTWAMLEADAAKRGIEFSVELAADAKQVIADATRLKQVFTNLLSNAVKYNHPQGQVRVSSRALDDGRVEITVADTGLGLSEAQQAQLFQPFNRLGRELSQAEGTGIGLVICKRLVEAMQGSLTVHSAAGEGSRFVLDLPAGADAMSSAAD